MARGIRKKLQRAARRANVAMSEHGGGKYARGLASEGYLGGYAQALADVAAMLDGVPPGDPRNLWTDEISHLDKAVAKEHGDGR